MDIEIGTDYKYLKRDRASRRRAALKDGLRAVHKYDSYWRSSSGYAGITARLIRLADRFYGEPKREILEVKCERCDKVYPVYMEDEYLCPEHQELVRFDGGRMVRSDIGTDFMYPDLILKGAGH